MNRAIILALTAVLAAPALAPLGASWGNDGIDEPSSPKHDLPKYMWPFPNDRDQLGASGVPDRLYFNAQLSVAEVTTLPQLPGGRLPPVYVSAEAFLGYWRDCNNDGYIGNAATGQTKYVAAVSLTPIDPLVCPTGSAFNPGASISTGPVYGLVRPMIYEFIQVGDFRGYLHNTPVPYALEDPDARVWGDLRRPDEPALRTPATYPFPADFWDSWNAHLDYVDALTYGRVSGTYGDATGWDVHETPLATLPTPITRARSLYSQESPESPDGRPLVAVWECDAGNPDAAPTLAPSVDPEGSVFDTTNNTMKGATAVVPPLPPATSGGRYQIGQGCDGPQNNGVLADGFGQPAILEREYLANDGELKSSTDFVFLPTPPFQEPRHQALPWALVRHNIATGAWFTRDSQLMDASDVRNAHYFTFYAKVGARGLTGENHGAPTFHAPGPSALPGATIVNGRIVPPHFVYGAEACGSPAATAASGWDCAGFSTGGPHPDWDAHRDPHWGVTLAETYHVRDTDCVDATVALGPQSNDLKDNVNVIWGAAITALFEPVPEPLGTSAFTSYCE